jgi:hypothetical protein
MSLQSETVIDSGWQLSPGTITKTGFAFVFSPMITNNICSIASGAFAEQGDVFKANVFARLLYGLCKHLSCIRTNVAAQQRLKFPHLDRVLLLRHVGYLRTLFWNQADAAIKPPS